MLAVAIATICALAASAMNAEASFLQRRATGQTDANQLFRFHLVKKVLANKLWLIGVCLEVTAFFAQALALYNGPLSLVAPIMTTDLVFLFFFLHLQSSRKFTHREWLAVWLLVAGLAGLLLSANPSGGHVDGNGTTWSTLCLIFAAFILGGATVMRRSSSVSIRTVVGGLTAGVHFSLTAAVTKLVVNQLSSYGVWHLFGSWPLYLLAVTGISSALTVQSMYGAGPLVLSQPALEIAEVLIGMLIGVYVFDETLRHSPLALLAEVLCGLVLCLGIIMLGSSKRINRNKYKNT